MLVIALKEQGGRNFNNALLEILDVICKGQRYLRITINVFLVSVLYALFKLFK